MPLAKVVVGVISHTIQDIYEPPKLVKHCCGNHQSYILFLSGNEEASPMLRRRDFERSPVHLLCNLGSDMDRQRQDGATSLYISAQEGRLEVVRLR